MGKGDKKTLRGKLFKGTFGKSRGRKTNHPVKNEEPKNKKKK